MANWIQKTYPVFHQIAEFVPRFRTAFGEAFGFLRVQGEAATRRKMSQEAWEEREQEVMRIQISNQIELSRQVVETVTGAYPEQKQQIVDYWRHKREGFQGYWPGWGVQ